MKEGMLKVQLIIPSIKADATLTANMKRGEEMECELKSDIKFLESTSEQKLSLKYGTFFVHLSNLQQSFLRDFPFC